MCSSICLALTIIVLEMVARDLLSPTDFSGAHDFCIHEFDKVVVICQHRNFVLATSKVVAPSFQSLKNL